MAKAPKAPGLNGPSTPLALVNEFTVRASQAKFHDSYWGQRVMASAAGPIAELLGEKAGRAWFPVIERGEGLAASALGIVAAGLARRGERDAAARVVAEAEGEIARGGLDGERGTIAWASIARAARALGDEAAVERALDRAAVCATSETSIRGQTLGHLAEVVAEVGSLGRLVGVLRSIPRVEIGFQLEGAARLGVCRAVVTDDAAALAGMRELLLPDRAVVLANGINEGAVEAARLGREVDLMVAAEAYGDPTYFAYGVPELALIAAEAGRDALARRLAELARDGGPPHEPNLADAFTVLGDDASAARVREGLEPNRRLASSNTDLLGRTLRLLGARRPERFEEHLAAHVARATALPMGDQIERRNAIGLALVAAGEGPRGASMIADAVRDVDAQRAALGGSHNQAYNLLGRALADGGAHLPALECMKKCTAKGIKFQLSGRIAAAYARSGDAAGAALALGYTPVDELKGLMNASDALHALAGRPPPYVDYA